MLKRHQVLLTDWQTEHLKLVAKENDLSFSELIRVVLSEGFIHTSMALYPECKTKEIKEKVEKISAECYNPKVSPERKHQLISELYFQARKATECINGKLQK